MKRILLNGSPRGDKGNSQVMLQWVNEGYGENLPIYQLNLEKYHQQAVKACLEADGWFIIIPLYFDSMPGQVMKFFETLSEYKDEITGKAIGALIQSGFPEGKQSFMLKDILTMVFKELGLNCKGIAIRGGSEGTRLMPESWQQKDANAIKSMGKAFKESQDFPQHALEQLIKPVTLSKTRQRVIKMGSKLGFANAYWNNQLKKNKAMKQSFDAPYTD